MGGLVGLAWAVVAPVLMLGVEPAWQADVACGAYTLPVIVDYDGNGAPNVVVGTRFDGMVSVLDGSGAVVQQAERASGIEGLAATLGRPGLLIVEESAGRIGVRDCKTGADAFVTFEGEPVSGGGVCTADIDGNNSPEVVCARRDGIVSAFDAKLSPRWQCDLGVPIHRPLAVAPVYVGFCGIYVATADGALHALSGDGRPLWRFLTGRAEAGEVPAGGPIAAQILGEHASVLLTDNQGGLYAIDAVHGHEQWRVQVGMDDLGAPAVVRLAEDQTRKIITVTRKGHMAVVNAVGSVLSEADLPPGLYVPYPLVADVDGDGQAEVIVANSEWSLVIAALDGRVKERLPLRGSAIAGVVLADVDRNGLLELVAATDCARVHCFATRAKEGWTHPRGDASLTGCLSPIAAFAPPAPKKARRGIRVDSIAVSSYVDRAPFASAFVRVRGQKAGRFVCCALRRGRAVVGSACKPLNARGFTVPFVRTSPEPLTLDLSLHDEDGNMVAVSTDIAVRPSGLRLVELAPFDDFLEAVRVSADAYTVPDAWQFRSVAGREAWHMARCMPDDWQRFGLARQPFIGEAGPWVWSPMLPGEQAFGPAHPFWPMLKADVKPFFVQSDFRPETAYPWEAYRAISDMAGSRFLGFPVEKWGEDAWARVRQETTLGLDTLEDITQALKNKFDEFKDRCYGRIYEGQGKCLFHHQAFAWGAPTGFAEIGGDVPCTPLQFAFLRGAARQYGGRPWGASISNTFFGAAADTRYRGEGPRVTWTPSRYAEGPDCGHSPSLELRLGMAAHLAGATFLHHESDARNGSIFVQEDPQGRYALSPFGVAVKTWDELARTYPDRGVPYTPIAFLIDFHRCWQLDEDRSGMIPADRADESIEAVFHSAYGWDGRRDLERGHLTAGPCGDIFDVVTDNAGLDVFRTYGVLWPVGDIVFGGAHQQAVMDYVKQGGIVVLDATMAKDFPSGFLGVTFSGTTNIATQIQTALAAIPPASAPYVCRGMIPGKGTQTLAWTDGGAPLLAWRAVEKGIVITAAVDYWLDERNHLLSIAPMLLRLLADAFLPILPPADVETLFTRLPDGWIIGLINNNGVKKSPTQAAAIDPNEAVECLLHFKKGVPLQFRSRRGEFRWNYAANGLYTRLQPGEVAIVKATLPRGP